MTIVNPTEGIVRVDFSTDDLIEGTLVGEIEITTADSLIITQEERVHINVRGRVV
jgi:hypothetical protein